METFASFFVLDEAEFLQEILKSHGIESKLDSTKSNFDVSFANNENHSYLVRLHQEDFSEATQILKSHYQGSITEDALSEHYFQEYSDEELTEVANKPVEWNYYDYYIALAILEKRGVSYSEEDLYQIKESHEKTYYGQKRFSTGMKVLWLMVLILLPLIAVVGGLAYSYIKQMDEDGNKRYSYTKETRSFAAFLVIAGVLWIVALKFIGVYENITKLLSFHYVDEFSRLYTCCTCY